MVCVCVVHLCIWTSIGAPAAVEKLAQQCSGDVDRLHAGEHILIHYAQPRVRVGCVFVYVYKCIYATAYTIYISQAVDKIA